MKKVKFGLCEWSSPIQGPYVCKFAKELGLDGIEVAQGDYEHSFPLSNRYIQDVYLEEAARYGIEISGIAVNCLDFNGLTKPDTTAEKQVAIMAVEKAVEAARRMKLPMVQVPAFGKSYINSDADFQELVKYLQYTCKLAQEDGIIVASENALSAEQNIKLSQCVGADNFRIYFDTQNPYINNGYDSAAMIRQLGSSICEVHVKDGKEGELSAALLGEGTTSYYESVNALCEIGYTGFVHLENFYDQQPMNHGDKDAVVLLRKDVAILQASFEAYNSSE